MIFLNGVAVEITTMTQIQPAKGQIISKRLFGILNSSKKWTKKIDLTTMYDTSGRLVFVCFLEEFEDKKRHFEKNWTLVFKKKSIFVLCKVSDTYLPTC